MVLVESSRTTTEPRGESSDTPPPASAGSPSRQDTSRTEASLPAGPTQAPQDSPSGEHPASEPPPEQDTESEKPGRSSRPQRTFKFREDFDVPGDSAAGKKPRQPATPAPPKQSTDSGTEIESPVERPLADDSSIPPDAATSFTTRRYQQWLLIGAAALLGLILAVLLVGIFAARSPGNGTARVGSKNGPAAGPDKAAAPPGVKDPPSTADPEETAKNGDQRSEEGDVGEPPVPDSKESTDVKSSPRPSEGEQKTEADEAAEDAADGRDADQEPVEKENSEPEGPQDPVADSSDPADGEWPPDTLPPPEAEGNGEEGKTAAPSSSTKPSDPPRPPAKRTAQADILPPDGATGLSESETRDRLSTPLVAIEHSQIPLADFAEFVSKLAAVPVTLDVDVFPPLGITAETPLAFDLRDVTIKGVLETALEPVGLTYSVQPGQIVITADEPLRERLSTRVHDVADLADHAEAANRLAAHITALIASGSWESEGGEAALSVKEQSLEIRQTELVHFRIARFLDRLRAVRGLPPRGDLPSKWRQIPPAFALAAAELNAPLRAMFIQPTPLRQILEYIETQANLRILTDWRALGELNLTPSFSQSIELPEQPLHELFDAWLHPMKLDYRVLDAHTVQISSRAAITACPELELYPVKDEWDDEKKDLLTEIKAHVGTSFFSEVENPGAIAYDSASRCLLVSLPQPQQRTVFTWLRQQEQLALDVNGPDE